MKSTDDKADRTDKNAKKDTSNEVTKNDAPPSSVFPPSVANANAQIAAADGPAAAATAMTDRANDNVQAAARTQQTQQAQTQQDQQAQPVAGNPTVAPDQLNEVDRTLHEDSQPAAPKAVAADAQPPRPAPVMAAATTESSNWDQTSLIGKIFIGFGALLTLASAARMFMA